MKIRLLTTVAVAVAFSGFIGTARAADVVPQDTGVDWSGFYLGAQIGYGQAYMSGCIECTFAFDTPSFADDLNLNGIAGGLHAGYNWQSGAMVFGIEGDVNFTDWKDSVTSPLDPGDVEKASVDTLGSIRGRLGITAGDALLYGTAGVALSDAEWTSLDSGSSDTAHFKNIGGVVGGGVELMVFSNTSIRAQGLYYFFNDKEDVSSFNRGATGEHIDLDDMYVVSVGATWHFN
jgi:outer membrane immunogenic protein